MRSLDEFLRPLAASGTTGAAVAGTVAAMAAACGDLQSVIAAGGYPDEPPERGPAINASGDVQKRLDAIADDLILARLRQAPVAAYASEEQEKAIPIDPASPVMVAVDPLDGSSNIDTNMSIGTIFTVLPVVNGDPDASLLQAGSAQLAAGFVIYGPRTSLVVSVGTGTHIFILDPASREFRLTHGDVKIPRGQREYAINSSNYRHWDDHIRAFIDDCVAGDEGPLAFDFNMRWGASLVAEAYRIFQRGGVFLYPGDAREKYRKGRLRLVYEAIPMAFLVEQAGGAATTGQTRILDIVAKDLHQRTPLVFGSGDHVDVILTYYKDMSPAGNRWPLFGRRGLLRA